MNPTQEHEDEPEWLKAARAELARGVKEIAGPKANERILDYFRAFAIIPGQGDETPWCSIGACFVMELGGYRSPRSARARDWLKWGEPLTTWRMGCMTVLSRGTNKFQGHVGLQIGESAERVLILGGNQGNTWSIVAYPKSRVLGHRWPTEGLRLPVKA